MYEYRVKEVTKVVDGDTVDVILDLGFGLFKKERVRVAGIDSPESRTRNKKENEYGLQAKAYLKGLLSNAEKLYVKTEKDGKYGRMLGWFYCEDFKVSLNEHMITAGYAWSYDGGTKLSDDDRFELLDQRRQLYAESRSDASHGYTRNGE